MVQEPAEFPIVPRDTGLPGYAYILYICVCLQERSLPKVAHHYIVNLPCLGYTVVALFNVANGEFQIEQIIKKKTDGQALSQTKLVGRAAPTQKPAHMIIDFDGADVIYI